MNTTKHREVAKLDRVPLPVEAARIGATGWQLTRTGARVVTKLIGRGSLQEKIIKQIPQTFSTWAPRTSSSARSSRRARAPSVSQCAVSSAACSTRYRPPTQTKCTSCSRRS